MLTTKGYILIGTVVAFLAISGALAWTSDKLADARDKIVQLEGAVGARDQKIGDLEAQVLRVSSAAVAQSEAADVVCRGTGAELFARGRQVGRAEACVAVTVR